MQQPKNIIKVVGVLFFLSLLAACASGPPPAPEVNEPGWVMKGSGAFDKAGNKVFYGVGSANGIKNKSLLRKTADNRARNEIAQVFEVYTSSLMKDAMEAVTADDPNVTGESQVVEQAIKTVTSATLNGVEIVNRWIHPVEKDFYSLAKMDLERFKGILEENTKTLSDEVREKLRERADKLHEQLEKEEAKR